MFVKSFLLSYDEDEDLEEDEDASDEDDDDDGVIDMRVTIVCFFCLNHWFFQWNDKKKKETNAFRNFYIVISST